MQYAFYGSNLIEITMPPVPFLYGNYDGSQGNRSPFYNCAKLKRVYWGDCRPLYTSSLFGNCSSLEYYDGILPAGLKKLDGMFGGCTSLTRMIFYEGIEEFGGLMFQSCNSIRYVEFPSTTKSLSLLNMTRWAFTGGIHIVVKATIPPTCKTGGENRPLFFYVPASALDAYKSASGWVDYANRIYPMSELPDEYRAMGTL